MEAKEFRPVAVASAVAVAVRPALGLGALPLFDVPIHTVAPGLGVNLSAIGVGLVAGQLSLGLTYALYAAEDGFEKVPIPWIWWPAIGGRAIARLGSRPINGSVSRSLLESARDVTVGADEDEPSPDSAGGARGLRRARRSTPDDARPS